MFKPHNLALMIAVLLGVASAAYAATTSSPTTKVVGFKPIYKNTDGTGAVSGKLMLGEQLTVDPEKLDYFDHDGDKQDLPKVKYRWSIDGNDLGDTQKITIPDNQAYIGKPVTLEVTPVSETGDPQEGKTLVLTDLVKAGATGGDGNGNITDFRPFVTDLHVYLLRSGGGDAGVFSPGGIIRAEYQFHPNGGDPVDNSVYKWGYAGTTSLNIDTEMLLGFVLDYEISTRDVGEVLEFSLQARNGAGVKGNRVTVDSTGKVTTVGGGTATIDLDAGGKVAYVKADPVSVSIVFKSTATPDLNGIDGVRPVANVDTLTAQFDAERGASDKVADYTFRWLADNQEVVPATKGADTFTPQPEHQGKAITVEVAAIP
ncbi:hypothetical protein [Aeromonas veronii]|uniref:hypothetical protein n=1 Tax=Aeromonas veronii TaxID=654 RepID=UPI003D1A5555